MIFLGCLVAVLFRSADILAQDRLIIDHERVFRQFLNAPVGVDSEGAGDHWRKFRQFHRSLLKETRTNGDIEVESSILSEIGKLGISPEYYTHIRVTCRFLKCEYVVILKDSVSYKKGLALSSAFQNAGDQYCKNKDCDQSVIMSGGGPKGDGVAILIQKTFKHF